MAMFLLKKLNATNFNINTSNGRVELREINSPKIIAETNNGIMDFKDVLALKYSCEIEQRTNNARPC